MNRVTRIDYNHGSRVFVIIELVGGEECHYQTKDLWQVIQRIQNLVEQKEQEG